MTAEAFANLVNARKTGSGKWLAKCPSHGDRHPSLSISQGRECVLVKCQSAGCTVDAVCKALGLSVRDLFHDRDLTPSDRREATQRSREREAESRAAHHAGVERNRELLRLERLRDSLGGLWAKWPEDSEVSRLFHGVLDKLRCLESFEPHHENGPPQRVSIEGTPSWIGNKLHQVFQPERAREHDPNVTTFDELTEWAQLQQETTRLGRAA